MKKELLPKAEQYAKQNKRKSIWRKFVRAMACVVVFCTTYALILPAITMERPLCEQEEHTHSDSCYVKLTSREVTRLACDYDMLGVHEHGPECLDADGKLVCGLADYVVHEHDASCRDANGALVCILPEIKEHEHTEECYQAEEVEAHVHDETCYTIRLGELVCELTETEGHTHTDECKIRGDLVCGQDESEGHAHGEACSETVLVCDLTVEPHVHGDSCWTQLVCELTEDENHAHSEECSGVVLNCDLTEQPHVHGDGCYQTNLLCDLPESAGHSHDDSCYAVAYICGLEESEGHSHEDSCYEQVEELTCQPEETEPTEPAEPELICEEVVIKLHTHDEDDCYEIYLDENEEEQKRLICEEIVVEEHIHSEACFVTEEVPLENVDTLTCGQEEGEAHTHTERCYGSWELVCGKEEHEHTLSCSDVSEEGLARIEAVIAAIDTMPSADEIDEKVAQFQEQGDEDGEVAYLEEVFLLVQQVYQQYSYLGEELQQYVTNADKLLALEYIWSAVTLDNSTTTHTVYHINTYSSGTTQQKSGTVMFVGSPVQEESDQDFSWWKEVVVEWQDGYLRVDEIKMPGDGASKVGDEASDTGFILLFHDENPNGFPTNVAVGDYVSTDFFIHQDGDAYSYNASGYGNVTFSKTAPDYTITSAPTTVLQYQENGGRVAHTADFVDMNVYNYNYSVNDTWRSNKYYPGFQWPGGAYVAYDDDGGADNGWAVTSSTLNIGIPNYRVHRQYVDSISFGDSIVYNHQYADSKAEFDSNANGKYGKAVNATGVAKVYDQSAAQSVGKINWLWYSGSWADDSISNRPVGLSTTGKVMQAKMYQNAPITNGDGISLKYLFPYDLAAGTTNSNGVKKLNSQSVDGLFQVNPVSGLYYYNSHNNHAQYSNNRFTLYEETITPDFLLYPFGNFLPFNDINTEATQVGAFNYSGGMKTYVDGTVYNLQKWMADARKNNNYPSDPFTLQGYSSRYQLGIMLNEYAESWHNEDNGATWNALTSGSALSDFFTGTGAPAGAAPTFSQEKLNSMYNIDWDKPTDFFFGMDMSMNFLMPKNGLTGHDNGNNTTGSWTVLGDGTFVRTGEPDDIPDYPMVFNFAGDDDVWVYVDGLLFLDLTGIHRHVGGTIDFETGMVYYFGLDTAIGDTSNNTANANYYYAETFEEIIKRSFTSNEETQMNAMLDGLRPVLDASGNPRYFAGDTSRPMMTFKDYTTHSFKFFYMERGSGSSVCRINFNFPMLRENAITVSKKNVPDDATIKAMGNPDYYFNIIKRDESGPFIAPGTQYTILDAYGNEVGTGTVDEFGIFTIKAGQSAVFDGIQENTGEYYVQELIKDEDYELYGTNVMVNGGALQGSPGAIINWAKRGWYHEDPSDAVGGEDETGPYGHKWHMYSSPYGNSDASSTFFFEMQNGVITENLGKLSISKVLDGITTSRTVDMEVTLDGEKLPVGTKYMVGSQEKTVETEGIISVGPGETAVISNIISGTRFTVREINDKGAFHVTYTTEAEEANTDGAASGIVRVNTEVAVTVTNTPDLDISVVKELTNTSDVDMVGDPYFSFQIMKGKADGSHSQDALYGAGIPYKVYDATTGEPIREDKTGDFGIFKIKAGERAELNNVQIDTGKYYIREVLEINSFVYQFDSFYVDDVQTQYAAIEGHDDFIGVSSTVKDLYDGDTVFTFNNKVNSEKLSYLTITKKVHGVSAEDVKTLEFDMMVELNGTLNSTEGWVPIPVGTPYTLYDTDAFINSQGTVKQKIADRPHRVVTEEGIVTVPGGATAEIDYMIPGTTYRVYETSGSAEGYTVVYKEFWGTEPWIKAYDDRVEGTIPVYNESNLATAHVCMTVTNSLPSANVQFSVYKQMINGALDANAHTVSFTAKCITATAKDGTSVDALLGTGTQARVTISDDQWNEAKFLIGYDYYAQFDGNVAANNWPVRLIYEITEVPSEDLEYTHDATKYYVTVDVNLTKVSGTWKFTATPANPKPAEEDGTVPEYATFQNYLLGDLTLEKQVVGGTVSQENGSFDFTVQIGTNDTTALQNWTVQVIKNGGAAETQTTSAEGKLNLTDIKHGDRVQLRGIPLGCVWKITETNTDGYQVSWTVNGTAGSGNSVNGGIPAGGVEVVFTNTSSYVLPDTGGTGTIPYTMAGLVLICFSMAYLLYSPQARKREEF